MLTVVCVGRARERYWADAIAEYVKRLGAFGGCRVVEVADEPEPKQLTDAAIEQTTKREAERILAKLPPHAYVAAMCIDGREYDSPAFAARTARLRAEGRAELAYVIGGSLGLHADVLRRADERVSMGRLTMPHQLARVVLLEQLYRCEKILSGQRYHK